MITIRKSGERGHFEQGWLDTYHTFSFADYYDPRHMHFRALRVINEDRFQPGSGFGAHPHRDMEIVTLVLSGQLEHRDSLGHGGVIGPGELQKMTAGTGIVHSEANPSATEPVHLYQIWLLPMEKGLKPGYEQLRLNGGEANGRLRLVASPDGRDGSMTIHSDAELYHGVFNEGDRLTQPLGDGRHAWLQVLRGAVGLNGQPLSAGDGAALTAEPEATIRSSEPSEVLLFDLG